MLPRVAFLVISCCSLPVLHAAEKAEIRQFGRLDDDANEVLSPGELSGLLRNGGEGFEATTAAIHGWFDGDDSGGIDLGEWLDSRGGGGGPGVPDLKGEVGDEMDTNGNGLVSRREFWKVIPRFVGNETTRAWFAAQFPSGQTTGSTQIASGATLTTISISAVWATISPGSATAWLQGMPSEEGSRPVLSRADSWEQGVEAWQNQNPSAAPRDPSSLTLEQGTGRRGGAWSPYLAP